jgi:alanine racemase
VSIATTHLDAIENNLRAVQQRVGERLVLAPVKANAYGHGAVAVATMIQETGCADWLGVALVSEGLELRAAGIQMPILKLSVERDDLKLAIEHGITLTVIDKASALAAAGAAKAIGARANVHLKVDTGMRRIGVEPAQAAQLAQFIVADEYLNLTGVFSHMPISDSPAGQSFSLRQIEQFAQVCDEVEAVAGPLIKHLANSGAVLGYPDAWFDMVRPGIMIYGSYPDPEAERSVAIEPGLSWTSELSFVKQIKAGETVGYGRTWTAAEDTYIGTVPVGYGDGYSRLLSNRGRVIIDGAYYPIVGRVCMDQFMVDLGPATTLQVGDGVTLIGSQGDAQITASELAETMQTIPYEVTCLITARVERRQSS